MLDMPKVGVSVTANASTSSVSTRETVWITAATAAIYPWILDAFHWAVTPAASEARLSVWASLLAALLLLAAFAVPLVNLQMAFRAQRSATLSSAEARSRRFALLTVTAPTVYVFFGVLTYMAGSTIPDTWIWTPAWLLLGYRASRSSASITVPATVPGARLRVVHGISGSIAALYVLFHLFNHLFGLVSPDAHAAVMEIGRKVYRAAAIEPLLVAVMLFQIATGLRLAWSWNEASVDRYRLFQIASGVFMSFFILGHMNSVFFFARTFLHIPTDWAFATGAPTGLIHDPWNIRLVPHYALGVFLVLAHLASGMRVVMLAHGLSRATANRAWWAAATLSAGISAAIMCGMSGLRLV